MSIAEKLATVAENEQKVYDAGKKAEYDEFWDAYQQNGARTEYLCAFGGRAWVDKIFEPKYNMKPTNARYMFFASGINNIVGILKNRQITIDFSNCTNFENAFSSLYASELGVIDMSKATNTYTAISYNGGLTTIEKLIVSASTPFSNTFVSNPKLTNLTIEGTIAKNGFSVSSCTNLTKSSIESIIRALSTTTTGLTVTLSKTAVNNAFGINVDDPTTWGEGTEYYELRHSRDNWTISYV